MVCCEMYFDILNGRSSRVWRTDGQTNRMAFTNE